VNIVVIYGRDEKGEGGNEETMLAYDSKFS
jgi:hypothetical protein